MGLLTSFLGSLPLGMLNLTAVDIALHRRFRHVVYYAFAVAFIEIFQIAVAIGFGTWFADRPEIEYGLHVFSVPFLMLLGLIFLRHGQQGHTSEVAEQYFTPFVVGLSLSAVNMLAIPFWLFYVALFHARGWFLYQFDCAAAFVAGCFLSTFAVLVIYGWLGLAMKQRMEKIGSWSRYAIALIFFLLALYQIAGITGDPDMRSYLHDVISLHILP
jgi:hypothetical protein